MSRHADTHFTDGEMEAQKRGEQTRVTFSPGNLVSVPGLRAKDQEEEGQTNREPRGEARSTVSSENAWGGLGELSPRER